MRIDVLTILPLMVEEFASASLLGRARNTGVVDLRVHDLRDETDDFHRTVDDSPFGGGAGMVLKADPIFRTVEAQNPPRPLLLLGPGGDRFDQDMAAELAASDGFSMLCGRYEGIDERVHDHLVDRQVSIGDFIVNGGEVAAMVILEAVTRLLPGAVGNEFSILDESFSGGLLEYPQYTRPAEYRNWEVPDILRSGDHAKVQRWRRAHALRRTITRRPDLMDSYGPLTSEDQAILEEFPDV